MRKKSKTWMDAARFYVGVHAIPGSFGVNAMSTVANYALNAPLPRDSTLFAYTGGRRMLLVLYIGRDGRREMTKYYPPSGHRFVAPDAMHNGKGPAVPLTRAQIQRLPDMVEDRRPKQKIIVDAPSKKKGR